MSNIYTKPISFRQLFTIEFINEEDNKIKEKIDSIEIPIIQRDYAQGRETPEITKIRNTFLNVLHNALVNQKSVKLDFVYGDITQGKMIPLDGQQRLTTLFLLHWYIAWHENAEDKEFLTKFTYRTRFSSRDFCDALVSFTPDFSKEKLSTDIIDQSWFMSSWLSDPTIASMLVVIDELHKRFCGTENLWQYLIDDKEPMISFYFLPIAKMGLTDSLYIKMNSRGKPLTPFEHFKASFEKTLKTQSKELYEEFIHKIDNDWTNILWKYRDENITDNKFMKYYRYITELICYQNGYEILEDDFLLTENVYGTNCIESKSNLRYLFDALDCWNGIDIDLFFEKLFYNEEYEQQKINLYNVGYSNLFLHCCNDYGIRTGHSRTFTLNASLMLYGVLQFQMNQKIIVWEDMCERLRIVRNLVLNSSDEVREERMQALLAETREIILEGKINLDSLGYSKSQKEEEVYKRSLRNENPAIIPHLCELEDHNLLQGTLQIIDLEDIENFEKKKDVFFKVFDNNPAYLLISRAMLTINDYSQLLNWRFLMGNDNASSWRELFSYSGQRKRFGETKACVNKLLNLLDAQQAIAEQLENIVQEYLKEPIYNWRYYFVRYESMRLGRSGMYYWHNDRDRVKENSYEMYMMNTTASLSGRHWDPFLYEIYTRNEELGNCLFLEEYGNPLYINETGVEIFNKNDRWELKDKDGNLSSIPIPQKGGVDQEDRINILMKYLVEKVNI